MGEAQAGDPPAQTADAGGGLDRRAFMLAGAAAVTAGVVVAQAPVAFARTAASTLTTPSPLSRSTFVPLVGKSFKVAHTTTVLTLVEIADLAGAAAGADSRFSLLFQGAGPQLDSAVATLKGNGLTVAFFVSSVDRGVVHQHYQAVVNRIV